MSQQMLVDTLSRLQKHISGSVQVDDSHLSEVLMIHKLAYPPCLHYPSSSYGTTHT